MHEAQRLLLIKQCIDLAKEVNCKCNTQDFKQYGIKELQRIYINMSKHSTMDVILKGDG